MVLASQCAMSSTFAFDDKLGRHDSLVVVVYPSNGGQGPEFEAQVSESCHSESKELQEDSAGLLSG